MAAETTKHVVDITPIIIQSVVFFVAGLIAFMNLKSDVRIVSKKIDDIDENLKKTKEEFTKLKEHTHTIDEYIGDLSKYFQDFKEGTVTGIKSSLLGFKPLYKANSPVRLTQEGLNFLESIGFIKIFNDHKELFTFNIKSKLEDKKDDVDFFYFAEKYSLDHIKELYEEESDLLISLRRYLFGEGLLENKKTFLNALGYFLRDEIIKEFGKEEEFNKIKGDLKN